MLRILCALALLASGTLAQIPTPESVIGHEVGADYKLAKWDKVSAYFRQLGQASDRVLVETLDWTGQELYEIATRRLRSCTHEDARARSLGDFFAEEFDPQHLRAPHLCDLELQKIPPLESGIAFYVDLPY